jgi:hypothetical protein
MSRHPCRWCAFRAWRAPPQRLQSLSCHTKRLPLFVAKSSRWAYRLGARSRKCSESCRSRQSTGPHRGLDASDLLHQLSQSLGVCASLLVIARIEKRCNAESCGLGLIVGHESTRVPPSEGYGKFYLRSAYNFNRLTNRPRRVPEQDSRQKTVIPKIQCGARTTDFLPRNVVSISPSNRTKVFSKSCRCGAGPPPRGMCMSMTQRRPAVSSPETVMV